MGAGWVSTETKSGGTSKGLPFGNGFPEEGPSEVEDACRVVNQGKGGKMSGLSVKLHSQLASKPSGTGHHVLSPRSGGLEFGNVLGILLSVVL